MVKKAMKTYTLSCKDIGSDDCGFSVTTHSIDEVKKAIFAHARYAHPEKLASMTEEQKKAMMEMIDKKFEVKKK
ncbi:MAG: DUF1059 domain-containing protein [Nanoarchaeota archaeon]|nr:DUF1059 domain-containing protein [Nanoarchaeota archaeon]